MSSLHFDRGTGRLFLLDANTRPLGGPWVAANFVDSSSKGPWPPGTFKVDKWEKHPGDGPDSVFGSRGILTFLVPGRDGMGIHAGRQNNADKLGRKGPFHCTFGCVRTTEDAMKAISDTDAKDRVTEITVT
jgi:hypothetical protein